MTSFTVVFNAQLWYSERHRHSADDHSHWIIVAVLTFPCNKYNISLDIIENLK